MVASKTLPDSRLQIQAFEISHDVARRFVRAPLALRALGAERLQLGGAVFVPGSGIRHHGGLDGAMHEQIRVAADRRGEVRILLEREAEMADVGLLIDGLGERANHQPLEQQRRRAARTAARPAGEIRAGLGARRTSRPPERVHDLLQFGHALLFGLAVHPVQASRLGETQRHRRLDVRGDHALLDQAMRIVAHHRVEALDPAVLADPRLDLAAAKIERAARFARRLQARRTRAWRFSSDARTAGVNSSSRAPRGFCEKLPCLIVGEPRMRADHRFVEARPARMRRLLLTRMSQTNASRSTWGISEHR